MAEGPDPYDPRATCDFKDPGQQFGESFECGEPANHKGSHYDHFTKSWAPNHPSSYH